MRLSKKGWVILTTISLIALAFAFYFLVYVKNKESEIIADKMRVLTQIKGNIDLLISAEERIRKNEVSGTFGKKATTSKVLDDRTQNSAVDDLGKRSSALPQGWYYNRTSKQSDAFLWEIDSASWKIEDSFLYKKAYHELFSKELVERKDEFEFIAIALFEENKARTLFTNHPLGKISFPSDSTFSQLTSKNVSELDFGTAEYLIFGSPLQDQNTTQVYLLGFVNKLKYNEEKREVSVFLITVTVILLTLIILALPIIKLHIMSNAERLGARDVILAGASMVFAPAVILLFILFFATNIFSDKSKEEAKLKHLHSTLSDNFRDELDNAVGQLKHLKNLSLKVGGQQPPENWIIFDSLNRDKLSEYYTHVWKSDLFQDNFRHFNSIFWTDTLANIELYLSSESNPTRLGSLEHRNYIMDIVRGKEVQYKNNIIAFESIRSVSDGNYEVGLGIPSGNTHLPVLATSFSMASLMDPVMEEGYGFCLFNEEGQTLFHSEIRRNLNEDFLQETKGIFIPYLRSGTSHLTSAQYMGRDHYLYFKRIPELKGYYLATFSDQTYTYSPNAIALNTTAEMQLAYLLLMVLAYTILFLAATKRKKVKQELFAFYWLRPMIFSAEHHPIYFKLLLIHLSVLLYLFANLILHGWFAFSPDLIIHSLLCSGLFLIVVNLYLLSIALPEKERIHTIFNPLYKKTSFWAIVIIYILVLLFARISYLLESPFPYWLLDLFILGAACYLIYTTINRTTPHPSKRLDDSVFSNPIFAYYKLYATSLILLFSVIPTLIFFSINYKTEQEILSKQKLASLVETIAHWKELKSIQFIKKPEGTPIIDSLDEFVQNMSFDSLNYALPESISFNKVSPPIATPHSHSFAQMYKKARIEFDEYGKNSQGFLDQEPEESNLWTFSNSNIYFSSPMSSVVISAPIKNFETLLLPDGWLLLSFLLLLILLVYGLLDAVIYRVFGLGYKEYADKLVLPNNYKKIGEMLVSVYSQADVQGDSYNNSFLVGINVSHVYEIYHHLKDWKKKDFYSIELLDFPRLIQSYETRPTIKPEQLFANSSLNFQIPICSLIVSSDNNYTALFKALENKHHRMGSSPIMVYIEHFEFAYDNEHLNRVKLDILQRLVSNPSIRVVISSEISPTKVYEHYEDSIKKATAIIASGAERTLENFDKINALKSEYRQWQHLLGGFFRITLPIEYKDASENIDFLEEELEHGHYLHRINNKYKVLYEKITYCEDLILNIQETSYTYYYAIWNSLTKEERYIIYDIAHDQFINTNNVDGIIDLLHKGILVYDHSLHLMNESFTNFVLTKVNSDEALERELESNKRGNWSTASAVLMLVIISLIVFISLGKINILQDVNALLGSLAAIFALLLRVGGMFVTGKAVKD